MKTLKLSLVSVLIMISLVSMGQKTEILTNENIVGMVSKKLPGSIIIGKIKSSQNSFDIGTDALISLTNDSVPENIVTAMIEAANDNSKHVIITNPNDPTTMHDPGIYYLENTVEGQKLTQLDPTIYSQNKSSGALGSALTYGLAKVKMSVTLDGSDAQLQINELQPEFYFYFDISGNAPNQSSSWMFSTASSPNEFLLVLLNKNKKTREVVTGSANISGSSLGVDDKNKATYKVEKIAPGIFKVNIVNPKPGEYCFMYAGSVPTGFTLNKVFDFGLKAE